MYLKCLEHLKDPKWKISDISLTSAFSDVVIIIGLLSVASLSVHPSIHHFYPSPYPPTCPRILQGAFDK